MTWTRVILLPLLLPWWLVRGTGRLIYRLFFSARAWAAGLVALVVMLIAYYALSDHYTPFTANAFVQAYVVQMAPRVEGQVVRVYVGENQPVTKGELLFEIDPRPFAHQVAQLEAKHAQAVQQVAQLESELAAARADDTRLAADEALAKTIWEQESFIFKKSSTTERKYLESVQKHKAAIAQVERGRALVKKAEQALAARVGNEHALVADVEAQRADARLRLEWTKVYAPATGYVTNVQLREGAYTHVGKPVMACIDSEQWWIVANYRENCLVRVQPGQPCGLTLNNYPGRLFTGSVQSVGWGVGEGQGSPSGELPLVPVPKEWVRPAQRFQVRVAPELPADVNLRVGSTGTVTIYTTPEDHVLHRVARWWEQIVAWFDYLY